MSDTKEPIYSDKYADDEFEYRHVFIPKDWVSRLPRGKLMTESEWRGLGNLSFIHCFLISLHTSRLIDAAGVQQSEGWEHYLVHEPEPHILLFRRPLTHPLATKPPGWQPKQQHNAGDRSHLPNAKQLGVVGGMKARP